MNTLKPTAANASGIQAKLYEIHATQGKQFYVEATSKEEALTKDSVTGETKFSCGDFDWEHIETTAKEIAPDQAEWIKEHHPEQIAKDE